MQQEQIDSIGRLIELAEKQQKIINHLLKIEGDKLLTTSEVAKLLNKKPQTILLWRKKGINLTFLREKGLIRYRKSEVLEYLNNR